jgi:hypothetical protein
MGKELINRGLVIFPSLSGTSRRLGPPYWVWDPVDARFLGDGCVSGASPREESFSGALPFKGLSTKPLLLSLGERAPCTTPDLLGGIPESDEFFLFRFAGV